MVIVSHDREFLDNLCTKIVETERGVATTYKVSHKAGGISSGVFSPFTRHHPTSWGFVSQGLRCGMMGPIAVGQ
jgi:hypothetical protein